MNCKYAIIPVAGYGSRRLPIVKAVEKCMLPVLNRPIIDYVIQDCVDAGIDHIVVVVGQQSQQFQRYFSRDEDLENYLRTHGKENLLDVVQPPKGVNFEFVVQPPEAPYGTATPVALARQLVPAGEPALVLMGDDLLYSRQNPIKALLDAAEADESAILATEVPSAEVKHYGVLALDENGYLTHMVEKPSPEEAPSRLINISKYLFTSDMLDEIETFYHEPLIPGQEKYINIEPFKRYRSKGGRIKTVRAPGKYLDVGTLTSWLEANLFIARDQGVQF